MICLQSVPLGIVRYLVHRPPLSIPSTGTPPSEYRFDIYEDAWISRAPLEEVVEYFVLAFQILKNVGLAATGITLQR